MCVYCSFSRPLPLLSSQVLLRRGPPSSSVDEHWPVVGQFSSIGSLGPSSQQWLSSEWLLSLSTNGRKEAGAAVTMHKYPNLQLVCVGIIHHLHGGLWVCNFVVGVYCFQDSV